MTRTHLSYDPVAGRAMTDLAIHQPYRTIFGLRRCQGCGQRLSLRRKGRNWQCPIRRQAWRTYRQRTTRVERERVAESTEYLFTVTEELLILGVPDQTQPETGAGVSVEPSKPGSGRADTVLVVAR